MFVSYPLCLPVTLFIKHQRGGSCCVSEDVLTIARIDTSMIVAVSETFCLHVHHAVNARDGEM